MLYVFQKDYEQYGLSIKVKFRDGEQLQELNHHLQSGGERAVATAIYMISLQDLTQVPFCCVDEINQVM
jgi:chromosome segregation ATPase